MNRDEPGAIMTKIRDKWTSVRRGAAVTGAGGVGYAGRGGRRAGSRRVT